MPGAATPQLLNYAEVVDVDLDATNDVNFADTEDYGHRVVVGIPQGDLNNYLGWERAAGSARPTAKLNPVYEYSIQVAIEEALAAGFVDIDGVTNGLHFGTANLNTNNDPRLRADGLVSANDIPLCFVLYKLYGSSTVQTLDNIYNLQDAYGMLSNSTVAMSMIESFKTHEGGAVDMMFRDLLSVDPHRFFDASGLPLTGIFETNADVSGSGTWKLIENDVIEVKLKMIFKSRVTRRGVAGREHNLTSTANENNSGPQENQQTVIEPEDYFYIRLQLKATAGEGHGLVLPPVTAQKKAAINWANTFKCIDGVNPMVIIDAKYDSSNNLYIAGDYIISGNEINNSSGQFSVYNLDGSVSSVKLPILNINRKIVFLIKYNSSGIAQWATILDTSHPNSASVSSMIIDSSNCIYITGNFASVDGSFSPILYDASGTTQVISNYTLPFNTNPSTYLIKYNTSGIVQWSTAIVNVINTIVNSKSPYHLALGSSDIIYLAVRTLSPQVLDAAGFGQTASPLTTQTSNFSSTRIIAYNSSGVSQWVSAPRAHSSGTTADTPAGLAVDSIGNIYASINISGPYSGFSIITDLGNTINLSASSTPSSLIIKYNTIGNIVSLILLVAQSISATTIYIDSSDNIYLGGQYVNPVSIPLSTAVITGNAFSASTVTIRAASNTDGCLFKYNSIGQPQWAMTVSTTTTLDNILNINTDSLGNIYVAGRVGIAPAAPIIYNANGNSQEISSVTLPTVSNVISTTTILIKVNSTGQAQWATYQAYSGNNTISALIRKNNSFLLLTNYTANSPPLLYNASGTSQTLSQITLNITYGFGKGNYLEYNFDGQLISKYEIFDAPTINTPNYKIKTDSSGNIYISGFYRSDKALIINNVSGNTQSPSLITLPTSSGAIYLIKYNSAGIAQWAINTPGAMTPAYGGTSIPGQVDVDSQGNVYMVGRYLSTASTITMINASGNSQVNSNFILTATDAGGAAFLVKYSTNGQVLWVTTLNGNGTTGSEGGIGVHVDSSDFIYMTGCYLTIGATPTPVRDADGISQVNSMLSLSPVTLGGLFLIKYNSDGKAQWASSFDGNNTDNGIDITSDSSSNIYVVGRYQSSVIRTFPSTTGTISLPITTGNAGLMLKYNSSGNLIFANIFDSVTTDYFMSILVDSLNNSLYVCGGFTTNTVYTLTNAAFSGNLTNSTVTLPIALGSSNGLLIKYNLDGQVQWATFLNGDSSDEFNSIAKDSSGNIYVSGFYNSTIPVTIMDVSGSSQNASSTLAQLPVTNNFASNFNRPILIKYSPEGVAQWLLNPSSIAGRFTATHIVNNTLYVYGRYSASSTLSVDEIDETGINVSSTVTMPNNNGGMCLIKYTLA